MKRLFHIILFLFVLYVILPIPKFHFDKLDKSLMNELIIICVMVLLGYSFIAMLNKQKNRKKRH